MIHGLWQTELLSAQRAAISAYTAELHPIITERDSIIAWQIALWLSIIILKQNKKKGLTMDDFERELKALLGKYDAEIFPNDGQDTLTLLYYIGEDGTEIETVTHIDYAGICS